MVNILKERTNKNKRTIIIITALLTMLIAIAWVQVIQGAEPTPDPIFSEPENLKDNVKFWKLIYTEISLKEGLIHHREYPMIIYKKLDLGNRTGRSYSNYLRYHINQVKQTLIDLKTKPAAKRTVQEQEIVLLFKKYASIEELKTAHQEVRFQQGQKERYKEGLQRSSAYMPHILAVFQQYGIPARIAYLPHVESSFNPKAYSRVGAAGIWQFMRRTGQLYMKIDYRIDERWDPITSSIAAAKLLRYNYKELQSWPLAITAYNHGLASIKRAVQLTGSRDLGVIIEKYQNRRFKFASKNFYGCFLAASEIAANPTLYFSDIDYRPPHRFNEISLKKHIRPRTLTKNLGISQELLQEFNPAVRPIVWKRQLPIPPGYKLRIPIAIPKENLDKQLSVASVKEEESPTRSSAQHYYTIRKGDTLIGVSRRFNIPIDELILANEIHREDHIYIGQVLVIPGKEKPASRTASIPSQPSSSTPDAHREGEANKIVTPVSTSSAPESAQTTTSSSETPSSLPMEDKTSIVTSPATEALETQKSSDAFDASLYYLDTRIITGRNQVEITTSFDETLAHYGEWLRVPIRDLRRINRNIRHIRLKERIRIPLKPEDLESFNATRLEFHMAQEEDFYNQYKVLKIKHRKVENGDTLWSICNRDEQIPIWLSKKFNRHIDIEKLKVNMTIDIPVVVPKNGTPPPANLLEFQ